MFFVSEIGVWLSNSRNSEKSLFEFMYKSILERYGSKFVKLFVVVGTLRKIWITRRYRHSLGLTA